MKTLLRSVLTSIIGVTVFSFSAVHSVKAYPLFDHTEVDQSRYIAIAIPFGSLEENQLSGYKLLILEQQSDVRACWQEEGTQPVLVEPLLLNFDFTGICGRATDSNGYSIRVGGQDLSMTHTVSLQSIGSEILLIGTSRQDGSRMIIGRSYGLASGFMKIELQPGWRFTKRTYQGQVLGHIYFTHDGGLMSVY